MIGLDQIREYLAEALSAKRYLHSENTAVTAKELAAIHGVDTEKAYLAGLLHDCTRELKMEEQHKLLEAMELKVDAMTHNSRELLHSHTAGYIIQKEFKILDADIISAVRFHTTGKEDMTPLEKIIFLSDKVEPSRNFPGVENIRQLAMKKLDEALLTALDSSVSFLLSKKSLIHPDTFMARNYVLMSMKE